MEIDQSAIELSARTYEMFQTVFTKAYLAFSQGKDKLIVRFSSWNQKPVDDGGLEALSYFHVKRVLCNLNLQGFVTVYKRKPVRPADAEPSERFYSYLEVHPTKKGFKAFEKGGLCKVPKTKIYTDYRTEQFIWTAEEIGIGKEYPGHDLLQQKYFDHAKNKYGVAMTRWYNWCQEYDLLFRTKLAGLKEDAAATEISALINRLVPTLPNKQTNAKIQQELERTAKLEAFAA